jgi:hypothetical protein
MVLTLSRRPRIRTQYQIAGYARQASRFLGPSRGACVVLVSPPSRAAPAHRGLFGHHRPDETAGEEW